MGNNFILKFQDAYIELILSGGQPIDRSTAEQLWATMENLGLKLGYNRFLLSAATSGGTPCAPARLDSRSGPTDTALVKVACVNVGQATLAGFLDDAAIRDHAVTAFFDDRSKALAWLTRARPVSEHAPGARGLSPGGGHYLH